MPVNYKRDYPPNWKEIANEVKQDAGWKCEWCEAKHLSIIKRNKDGTWIEIIVVWNEAHQCYDETAKLSWARLSYHGLTKVILTTAHLDRNSKNNQRANLAALCQRCHLKYDVFQHIANRHYGRDHKGDHQLKLNLQ